MAKQAQNDADGMLDAILEGLRSSLKKKGFGKTGKYGGVKNADARRGRDFGDEEAEDFEALFKSVDKTAGASGTGKKTTDAVMDNAREDPELNKLYEDRFKDSTPAAPSGTRGEMFDTTQLPSVESETVEVIQMPEGALNSDPPHLKNAPDRFKNAPQNQKPTAQSVKASAGRLLNPVGAESRGASADPAFFIGERASGQSAAEGGAHGGTIEEKPPANSETVAMQDTIADLQARLAKMELGGGSTPDYGTPDNPFGAIREPAAPQAVDAFEQSFKNKGGAPPPPGPAGSGSSPHAGYEAAAGSASGGAADDAAIRAAGQQDAASGGGNRGLMAALGSAFGGAKDAVGGAAGAVGGALGAIAGGPKPGLKPQYKDLTNVEIARLERQGIDVYESGVKPLPAMGGALSGGPALGSSMGTPMPPSPLGGK